MTQSASSGISARILTHARFNRPPVVQQPRRGRFPKTILLFWKAASDRRFAQYKEQIRQKEMAELRHAIAITKISSRNMGYELAKLTQFTR